MIKNNEEEWKIKETTNEINFIKSQNNNENQLKKPALLIRCQ